MLLAAAALSVIGVMTIYSATRPVLDTAQASYYVRQLMWIGISMACFFTVISIDYKWFIKYSYIFFVAGLVLLVFVLVAGKKGMGAQRWIHLGFIVFQPSELFKIIYILALSRYLAGMGQNVVLGLKELLKMAVLFFVLPAILILKQPHLGTVVIMLLMFLFMTIIAGTRRKVIVVSIIIVIISLPFLGNILWGELRDYQKQRIIAFINPYGEDQGVGYHIQQSKVTIGSGGLLGKGYMKGTQGPLRFLPERHTDFIFSVFAEEWGLIGSVVLFLLYLFILLKGFDTARNARDLEGSYLALGVTVMMTLYFFINAGMTLNIVPVVGVPMPFMSYGGTAILSNFIMLGLLINVRMRRFPLFY